MRAVVRIASRLIVGGLAGAAIIAILALSGWAILAVLDWLTDGGGWRATIIVAMIIGVTVWAYVLGDAILYKKPEDKH